MKGYPKFDFIVVGSGVAGVHAAQCLVEAGKKVVMVDYGEVLKNIPSRKSFNPGSVFNKNDTLQPIRSNIPILQGLNPGGLAEAWGGVCETLSVNEMQKAGLPASQIEAGYREIAKRTGLKQIPLDIHGKMILEKAGKTVHRSQSMLNYHATQTIKQLKKSKNFLYIRNYPVRNFKETGKEIAVNGELYGKYLILAAGVPNTTRIVLSSLGLFNKKVRFLTKSHYLTFWLHLPAVFSAKSLKVQGYCQLIFTDGKSHTQFYSFFKRPEILSPLLVVTSTRFEGADSAGNYMKLLKNNTLKIHFTEEKHKNELAKIKKHLSKFGLIPLISIHDPATGHYAGGVDVNSQGKLEGTKRIYIADSSGWKALSPKPPALTIMANARRVAQNALNASI